MKRYIIIAFTFQVGVLSAQTSSVQEDVYQTRNAEGFVIEEKKTQSNGDVIATKYQYPKDVMALMAPACMTSLSAEAGAVKYLIDKNILSNPVEVYTTVTKPGGATTVTSGQLTTYIPGTPYPKELYELEISVPLAGFAPYHPASPCTFMKSGYYALQEKYNLYDDYGNLLEKQIKNNRKTAFIYGYRGQYQTAVIENAGYDQVAYTSFESESKGNWTYSDAAVTPSGTPAFAGNKMYAVSATAQMYRAVPYGTYIVSMWVQGGTGPSIWGSTGSIVTPTVSYMVSTWGYREWTVKNTTEVNIATSGVPYANIDEVRLYPANAQMATTAYTPLVGPLYTCDLSGHFNFYSYDDLGRLLLVKDNNGNIIKKLEYGIQKPE